MSPWWAALIALYCWIKSGNGIKCDHEQQFWTVQKWQLAMQSCEHTDWVCLQEERRAQLPKYAAASQVSQLLLVC